MFSERPFIFWFVCLFVGWLVLCVCFNRPSFFQTDTRGLTQPSGASASAPVLGGEDRRRADGASGSRLGSRGSELAQVLEVAAYGHHLESSDPYKMLGHCRWSLTNMGHGPIFEGSWRPGKNALLGLENAAFQEFGDVWWHQAEFFLFSEFPV